MCGVKVLRYLTAPALTATMLDELFAKIDAPLRASLASPMRSSLASHMVRSHMMGDSKGKRAFMDFVELWKQKFLGAKTKPDTAALVSECRANIRSMELITFDEDTDLDEPSWINMRKIFMVLVLAACSCVSNRIMSEKIQGIASTWIETAFNVVTASTATASMAEPMGVSHTNRNVTSGLSVSLALDAGWLAIHSVYAMMRSSEYDFKDTADDISRTDNARELISETISKDVQLLRAEEFRVDKIICGTIVEGDHDEVRKGNKKITDLKRRIAENHENYEKAKTSEENELVNARLAEIKREIQEKEAERSLNNINKEPNNVKLNNAIYKLKGDSERLVEFQNHQDSLERGKALQSLRNQIMTSRDMLTRSQSSSESLDNKTQARIDRLEELLNNELKIDGLYKRV